MDGSELCNALVAASHRSSPAVLITGRNDRAARRLIEKTHPVAVLFKPVDEQTLFDAIARAIALSQREST
jgi:FixJ family two-component response regulator